MLLDNGTTEIFMDRKTAVRHGFKLQKLNRPVVVRNIDGMNNSTGAITYWVEVNVYYKGYEDGGMQFGKDRSNLGNALATSP